MSAVLGNKKKSSIVCMFLFGLRLNVPVKSYGQVETVYCIIYDDKNVLAHVS